MQPQLKHLTMPHAARFALSEAMKGRADLCRQYQTRLDIYGLAVTALELLGIEVNVEATHKVNVLRKRILGQLSLCAFFSLGARKSLHAVRCWVWISKQMLRICHRNGRTDLKQGNSPFRSCCSHPRFVAACSICWSFFRSRRSPIT
eukprot:6485586-Amphidinium_carterae.1